MFLDPGSGEIQFAGRERFADEYFTRFGRMAFRVVDAPPVVDQQAAEREPLPCVDEAGDGIPFRLVVDFRAEVRRGDFEIFGFDLGVLARKEAARLDEREREQPRRDRFLFRRRI